MGTGKEGDGKREGRMGRGGREREGRVGRGEEGREGSPCMRSQIKNYHYTAALDPLGAPLPDPHHSQEIAATGSEDVG